MIKWGQLIFYVHVVNLNTTVKQIYANTKTKNIYRKYFFPQIWYRKKIKKQNIKQQLTTIYSSFPDEQFFISFVIEWE